CHRASLLSSLAVVGRKAISDLVFDHIELQNLRADGRLLDTVGHMARRRADARVLRDGVDVCKGQVLCRV
ncbi:MAG: hypothetical protein WCI46_15215, partial [Verrucomicrobiota bacterium]